MLQTKLVTIQGRQVLLARPQSNQYGHQALEIKVAISRARQLNTDLYFLRDRDAVGPALYDIDTDAVRILKPTLANRAQILWKTAPDWPGELRERGLEVVDAIKAEAVYTIGQHVRNPEMHVRARRSLRETRARFKRPRPPVPQSPTDALFADECYSGRQRLGEDIRTFIREDFREEVLRTAARIGIEPGMKLVCMHAREPGYKVGKEAQDRGSRRVDSTRNDRIENYFEAMDFLVSRGHTPVRVGDASMAPVQRAGVIDLATHPLRTGMVELHAMLQSSFIMCGESGPFSVSYLTNTPMAVVNATCPVGGYPLRRDGFCVLKKVVDRASGRQLRLRDLIHEDYLSHVRDVTRYHYEDNTPEEVTAAASEMLEWLEGSYQETASQAEVRRMATEMGVKLGESVQYVRKHGPDRGFLGEGRMFRFFVDKLF